MRVGRLIDQATSVSESQRNQIAGIEATTMLFQCSGKLPYSPKSRQRNNPSIIVIVRIGGLETSISLLDYVR